MLLASSLLLSKWCRRLLWRRTPLAQLLVSVNNDPLAFYIFPQNYVVVVVATAAGADENSVHFT
jgi:hypothetical protein